jgi:hypothetical protein
MSTRTPFSPISTSIHRLNGREMALYLVGPDLKVVRLLDTAAERVLRPRRSTVETSGEGKPVRERESISGQTQGIERAFTNEAISLCFDYRMPAGSNVITTPGDLVLGGGGYIIPKTWPESV